MRISEYASSLLPKSAVIGVLQEVNAFFEPPLEKRILTKAGLNSFEEYLNKVLAHGHVIIAHEDSEIAGLLMFYANDTMNFTAYLPLLAIREKYQGRGLGKLMMMETLEKIKKKGMRKAQLNTWENNSKAIALYKKIGFYETERNKQVVQLEIYL